MITGEIKNRIDAIWDTYWVGGITNPMSVHLDAISRALNYLETKPKKYIRFQILDSKLYVSYKWNNESKVLEFIDLPPIAILKSSHR